MARMSATIAATLAKSIPLEPAVARGTVTQWDYTRGGVWGRTVNHSSVSSADFDAATVQCNTEGVAAYRHSHNTLSKGGRERVELGDRGLDAREHGTRARPRACTRPLLG